MTMASHAETSDSETSYASNSADALHSGKVKELSLVEKFDAACAATPQPNYSKVAHPSIPVEQHPYLVRNSDGIILLAPRATLNDPKYSRLGIAAALQSALRLAAGSTPAPVLQSANENAVSTADQSPDPSPESSLSDNPQLDPTSKSSSSLSNNKKSNESFWTLLGRPPFTPLAELESFTWENSLSKRVIERFVEEANRKKSASTSSSDQQEATNNHSFAKENKQAIENSDSNSKLPAPLHEPVDNDVLFAQQEAAASTILKDIRAAHVKLRKSASSFRPGEAPVWALLAQKDGKLKPEAAAEMARARVAAAAAAAVMREAADAERASAASSTQIHTNLSPSLRSASLVTSASASAALPSYGSQPGGLKRDYSNGFASRLRPPIANSSSVPALSNSEYNAPVLPPHHPSYVNTKPVTKKRVTFAEGTIFHQR